MAIQQAPHSNVLTEQTPASSRSRIPSVFRSLRHRDYFVFWVGNFLSNIGTWMQYLALGWLVLELTNSRFLLGLNGFLSLAPALFLSLLGGAVADRLNRRKLMLVTQSTMAGMALALAVLTSFHRINITEILIITLLTGLASAMNAPAYQAVVPDLVSREDLNNAVALNSAQFNMSRAVGPMLAGLTLGALGVAACFYLNSLSFFALIFALVIIRVPQPTPRHGPSVWQSILDALGFVNHYRLTLILLSIPSVLSLLGLPYITLMPAVARDLLRQNASGLGYLMAGAGFGAVSSALTLAAQRSAERKGRFIISSAGVFSLALILFAFAQSFWWAFVLLTVLGATMVGALALTNTTLQIISPPELRGRIMSLYNLAVSGLAPLGSLWAGDAAEKIGTRFTLALGGILCLIYYSLLFVSLTKLRRIAQLPWPDLKHTWPPVRPEAS